MRIAALSLALLLNGCGSAEMLKKEQRNPGIFHVEEQVVPPGIVSPGGDPAPAVVQPRIAYAYARQYRLNGAALAGVQAAHVRLCDALGPQRCRVATMERASADAAYATGSLSLQIDARIARAFGDRLDREVAGGGGALIGSSIQGEDLSKDMVDTEARIRAKQALATRLLGLLANRGAKVGELVEAERALATAQEELDAARTWLGEMRARIATSKFDLRYQATGPGDGWWEPVRRAFVESGRSFAGSLAALIAFLVIAAPWAALVALALWAARRRGWWPRLRFWRPRPPQP